MLSLKHLHGKTLSERKEIEQEHGVRYSELTKLPYYDPIRSHLIDPMNCLLLGVAKHTLKTWIAVSIYILYIHSF